MSILCLLLCVIIPCIGCTSFKTTVMQHNSDNRFIYNYPTEKTRGVPVKLKVPTHVEVRIIETFFIQNESGGSEGIEAAAKAAAYATAKGATAKAGAARKKADDDLANAQDAFNKAGKPDSGKEHDELGKKQAAKNKADAGLKAAEDAETAAKQESDTAAAAAKAVTPFFSEAAVMEAATEYKGGKLVVDKDKARQPVKCLSVDTHLAYTDKVFTVDFRRPAGGVLNLTGVNMDSQQYFAAIQAAYQEETIQQVNAALGTLASGTQSPAIADTTGTPTVTATVEIPPQSNSTATLGADTRVVAFRRFDISQPDWEAQMHDFVSRHVTGCNPNCQPPLSLEK